MLSGGFRGPHTESAQAGKVSGKEYERSAIELILKIDAPTATSPPTRSSPGSVRARQRPLGRYDFVLDHCYRLDRASGCEEPHQ